MKNNSYHSNLIRGLIFLITFFVFVVSSIFGLVALFIQSLFPTDFFDNKRD